MIQIVGPPLHQWDTGRNISVSGSNATHAHIANRGDSYAVIMELVNGETKIPDYLLQNGKDLCVYLVLDGITQESNIFSVRKRERPEDYVYSDDQRNYIYELITEAEEATEAARQVEKELREAWANGEFNGPSGERYVKSVNDITPDNYGNVDLENAFVVNLNSDDMTIDAGPSEMLQHILDKNGPVFLRISSSGATPDTYTPATYVTYNSVQFSFLMDDGTHHIYGVNQDRTVRYWEHEYATLEDVSDLEEAMKATVKSVNGTTPDDNGNVQLKQPLIVDIDLNAMEASHTPADIMEYILSDGGPVYGLRLGNYIPLASCTGSVAYFLFKGAREIVETYFVNEDGKVSLLTTDYTDVVRDQRLDEALSAVVKTVNGNPPDEDGNVHVSADPRFYILVGYSTSGDPTGSDWVNGDFNLDRILSAALAGNLFFQLHIYTDPPERYMLPFTCRHYNRDGTTKSLEFSIATGSDQVLTIIVYDDGAFDYEFTKMGSTSDLGDISTALDHIIELQNSLIGGDGA